MADGGAVGAGAESPAIPGTMILTQPGGVAADAPWRERTTGMMSAKRAISSTQMGRARARMRSTTSSGMTEPSTAAQAPEIAEKRCFVPSLRDHQAGVESKEPTRTIFNFSTDDVGEEKARLESLGVPFLGPPSTDPISFATFVDPDGNYGQVFSMEGAPAGLEMFALMHTSADPERMRSFFRDVVGLSDDFPDLGSPFMAGETSIYVGPHSETHGQAKEPARVLLTLPVADLAAEQKRLEGLGVKFLRSAGREPWGGIISTFQDPDGNFLQLMEYRPE